MITKLILALIIWSVSAKAQEVLHHSNLIRYADLKNITIQRKTGTDSLFLLWCNGGKSFLYRDSVEIRGGGQAGPHTHPISEVDNLQTELDGKAASSHTHTIANVTNLQTSLDGKAASAHNHAAGDINSGTFFDTRIAQSNVTQHQAALTIAQSQVTNLTTDLGNKSNLASPTFTGTPAAPTAAFGTNTTQIATTANVRGAAPLFGLVAGANVTTTGQALVDITGLSVALIANAVYHFEANLPVSTSAVTTGTRYGVNFSGAGATVSAIITGSSTSTADKTERISALNTATGTFLTTSAQSGGISIKGTITTGANAGNLTIKHLKVSSGTSTIFIGADLKAERIQ
jgi:hypothetical protein